MDRTLACGAGDEGSIPSEGTKERSYFLTEEGIEREWGRENTCSPVEEGREQSDSRKTLGFRGVRFPKRGHKTFYIPAEFIISRNFLSVPGVIMAKNTAILLSRPVSLT